MPDSEEHAVKVKRTNFFDRPKGVIRQDEWDTTYKTNFIHGFKVPFKKNYNYQSPYGQQSKFDLHTKAQAEKKQRLVSLHQPSIISEPLVVGLTNLCQICSSVASDELFQCRDTACLRSPASCGLCCHQTATCLSPDSNIGHRELCEQVAQYGVDASNIDCSVCDPTTLKKLRVYSKDMPVVTRPPLPGDISEPKFVQLQAKCWKGIPYPFADPRFDPFLPVCLDGSIAPSTLDPFKYCQRKRVYPQFNRCPNLPVSKDALPVVEPLGFSTMESKLYNRRWAKKRFPKPPEAFITRLW